MKAQAIVLATALAASLSAGAQIIGNSVPTPPQSCHEYQWPATIEPCPDVQIKQKHDHTPLPQYAEKGWDTVVSCTQRTLDLSCMPYIPVQFFDGRYYVDEIPYNPPDTTFALGTRMPIGTDDVFASTHTTIAYPFYFFGIQKTAFRIGANGLVTFCSPADYAADPTTNPNGCPYSLRSSNQLPWNETSGHMTPTYSGNCFNRMHDAIYGVYEDTHPGHFVGGTNNHPLTEDGIFYGVQDEYPCRKIICSWKEAPNFGDYDDHGTYQIVCYEGSNIIEVHVKQRKCCPTTSDALIGIQNATGDPQVKGSIGSSNMFVQNGQPAAFWPVGRNVFTSEINNKAYRFTPQGTTNYSSMWYRIFDDGRDSIQLTTDPTDTNGYFIPMGETYDTCPTLTRAIVSPTVPTKYVFELRFFNPLGDTPNGRFILRDTIFVGVDTLNSVTLRELSDPNAVSEFKICEGNTAHMRLEYPSTQQAYDIRYSAYRMANGEQVELNLDNCLSVSDENETSDMVYYNVDLNTVTAPTDGLIPNKIDSIYLTASVDFVSGCFNNTNILIRKYPNFNMSEVYRICKGETFHWAANNHDYTQTTNPDNEFVTLTSEAGCDSVVHLALTVDTVSHTVDHIMDCKPIRWINGKVYNHSNYETAATDTVMLQNVAGCDSVVQLDFTMHPLTAKLKSSLEAFDYDHLDVVLNDLSTGNDSRTWRFPYGIDQHGSTAYWSIPADFDEATIWLIANSPYGCVDSTSITLPFNKETFWVPNVFTPDNPTGNNTFGSVSLKTVKQEMLIYNRRGELVYKCEGVDCTWDGTDLHGKASPQGTYIYIIRYTNEFEPSVTKVKNGTVTLIR